LIRKSNKETLDDCSVDYGGANSYESRGIPFHKKDAAAGFKAANCLEIQSKGGL
jgi:hypothetical protein